MKVTEIWNFRNTLRMSSDVPSISIISLFLSSSVLKIPENYIDFCSTVKPDCISIDYDIDPKWIKEKLKDMPIQGGLDPKILLGDKDEVKKNTEKYLDIFKNYPYIFNLGHGVLPEIKPETIEYIIQLVRNKN